MKVASEVTGMPVRLGKLAGAGQYRGGRSPPAAVMLRMRLDLRSIRCAPHERLDVAVEDAECYTGITTINEKNTDKRCWMV